MSFDLVMFNLIFIMFIYAITYRITYYQVSKDFNIMTKRLFGDDDF